MALSGTSKARLTVASIRAFCDKSMTTQSALPLSWPIDYDADAFVTTAANREALEVVLQPKSWISPTVLLSGPPASGKTHLAMVFAVHNQATVLAELSDIEAILGATLNGCYVLDDVERLQNRQELLFHLLNDVTNGKGRLLLTGRLPPQEWVVLPDLMSRFAAIPRALLHDPDEAALQSVLQKNLNERGLLVDERVMDYILRRTERSYGAVRDLVLVLDRLALEKKKRITIPFLQEQNIFPQ